MDDVKKQLNRGRPKTALGKADLPKLGELPKKIMGSHMGYMQTGGDLTPPKVKGPEIGRPPKLPPKVRKAPPK